MDWKDIHGISQVYHYKKRYGTHPVYFTRYIPAIWMRTPYDFDIPCIYLVYTMHTPVRIWYTNYIPGIFIAYTTLFILSIYIEFTIHMYCISFVYKINIPSIHMGIMGYLTNILWICHVYTIYITDIYSSSQQISRLKTSISTYTSESLQPLRRANLPATTWERVPLTGIRTWHSGCARWRTCWGRKHIYKYTFQLQCICYEYTIHIQCIYNVYTA